MEMSINSQSITIPQKSPHQSIEGDETGMLHSSRNIDNSMKAGNTAEFGQRIKDTERQK
jgi:hypothetical protein